MDNKINSTDVGERINDTKKEIAQLSEELERLIKSNAGLSYINFERGNSHGDRDEKKSQESVISNRVMNQNIEASIKTPSVSGRTDVKPKIISELTCSKKPMSQNKEVTREFMRQQREKREEMRKKIDSKNKIDQELKKQKLLELQQKSLALVQRNLKLKQERSKSREKNQHIRLDKTNNLNKTSNHPSKKESSDFMPNLRSTTEVKCSKKTKLLDKSISHLKKAYENKDKLDQPDIFQQPRTPRNDAVGSLGNENPSCDLENNDSSIAKKHIAARKIQTCYKDYRARKLKTGRTVKEEKGNENPIRESKQTQTYTLEQIDFPNWLQPPMIDPYPCNFINTIKKKLQLVVSSPVMCKDVGIQNSIMQPKTKFQQLYRNHEKLSKEDTTKSKQVDYHSQQEANLNVDALQQFTLTQFREKYSKNNKEPSKSDSESDTSKNIPEISTESVLVSNETLSHVKHSNDIALPINTDNIKNLTLRKNEDVLNVHKNISKKSYTFNFSEEIDTKNSNVSSESIQTEEIHSVKYIRSPRDSIISFNISNDSETPSIVSQKSKQDLPSIESEQIKTENSNVSNEKDNSRRKLIFPPKGSVSRNRGIDNNEDVQETDFEKLDSSKYDLRTLSEQVSNSLKISPVSQISRGNVNPSHETSRSTKYSIELNNSSKKENELQNQKIESRSASFHSIRTTSDESLQKNDSECSEVILTRSIDSTIETTSLKFSNPTDLKLSSEMKNENNKSHPEIKIQTAVNSVRSNHSKKSHSVDKSVTDLSEADAPKLSEFILNEYNQESNNDKKMTLSLKFGKDENSGKKSEPNNYSISNLQNSKENAANSKVLRNVKSKVVQSKADTNEIHLKFEAEVHLLNDFNDSLKQFIAVEKAFESLKNKNDCSFRNNSKNSSVLNITGDSKISSNISKKSHTINMSRGSDWDESFPVDDSLLKTHLKTSNNLEVPSMQNSAFDIDSFSFHDNIPNNLAGLSIKMFEQFIKDEDIRIENLKTIIKIREQALLDRTKGELAWLEIQRKHLKETGKLHEASLVKKKQRGILLKHQQERREMQRLKQLQKIQSNERKTILKEQQNLIKAKLTSEKLMSEMKIQTPRKQRPSGPMKVLKATESRSETSLSRRASDAEEIFSITSRSRSIKLSEIDSSRELVLKQDDIDVRSIGDSEDIDKMKKALLVRQASLMKRRKAVEDLLKRHEKLLEEEKKIKELEMAANAIIMRLPSTSSHSTSSGRHLKEINSKGTPYTGSDSSQGKCLEYPRHKSILKENLSQQKDESQVLSKTNVTMNEYSFNTFYENAKATIDEMKTQPNLEDAMEISSSQQQKRSSVEYSDDFESEKQLLETESTENNLSSISELIEDFTQIEYGISMFSKQFNENTVEKSFNLEILSEKTKSPSSQEEKKNLNISSLPNNESIITSEISPSIITRTEEMKANYDTLNLIKDEGISINKDKQAYTGQRSSNVNSSKMSEEVEAIDSISPESSEFSSKLIYVESLEPASIELFLSKSLNEESTEEGNISSDRASFKLFTSSNKNMRNEVDTLKNDKDMEDTMISEEIYNSNVSLHSESEIGKDATENILSELISSENIEIRSSVGNSKMNLKQKNDEFISEDHDKSTLIELIENEPSELALLHQNSFIPTGDSEKYKEESDHEQIGEVIERTPNSTSITVISQISANMIPSENDELSESLHSSQKGESSEFSKVRTNKKSTSQNISSQLLPKMYGAENEEHKAMNKFSKLLGDKEKRDVINIQSSEMEETYQDITSIEQSSDEYVSEMKTDETTNNDISELNDVSELILQKENIALKSDDEEITNKLKSIKSETMDAPIGKTSTRKSSEDQEFIHHQQDIPENIVHENSNESSNQEEIGNAKNDSLVEIIATDSVHISHEGKTEFPLFESKNELEIIREGNDITTALILTEPKEKGEVEELPNESHVNSAMRDVEISSRDDSSTNSYTDDFDEDKEDASFIQEPLCSAEKQTSKIEGNKKLSGEDSVLMVRIDLALDPSKREAKIVVIDEFPTVISNHDEKQNADELNQVNALKSPVQQRVTAETMGSQKSSEDENTLCQDNYITIYEDITPVNSPESATPVKSNQLASINTFTNEAEELLKKQLAIELEIKHLEQQQKDQLPFVYMREIPNKPPPPYTPPSIQTNAISVLPTSAVDVKEICRYSAKVLYNAYLSNNIHAVTFSETHFKAINKTKCTKACCSFIFDLCREIAENHYKHFQTKKLPLWLKLPGKSRLFLHKPFDYHQLENHIHIKVMELLRFKKSNIKENSITKWSKKKKDHVDEILLLESQVEEQDWLNYDNDELMVKNEVTDAIFDILLSETIEVYKSIFS